ncbi:hypothetical protein MWU60_00350 [Yoonia sp. F2084L]|nr:hypothetical protein [Yoonia sp. F2084L]
MFARFADKMYLTKGEKSFVIAYAAVIAVAAGITVLIVSGLEGVNAQPVGSPLFVLWTILAGGLSGAVALYTARGWMGRTGAMGFGRAIIGAIAVALIASVAAGMLIAPVFGAAYAPVLLISEFIAKPWLAIAWFVVLIGAHMLMGVLTEERAFGLGRSAKQRATERLSTLSRTQLYHRD